MSLVRKRLSGSRKRRLLVFTSNNMTSLLESYQQQYSTLTADITHLIGKITLSHGVEKQGHVRQVEKLFEEASELLEQMDLEVKEQPGKDRQKYQTRVRSYKTELSKLQTDVRRAKLGLDSKDDCMLDDHHDAEDQRTRLLENTERLERSGRKLDHGYHTAVETEQIGSAILENLHSQRQTINRSRARVDEMNTALGKSSRLLTGMMKRIIHNRIMLVVIGLIMVISICVALYLIVRRSS
ncbi:vesicle transport through interaction with t-SNAREs homolog 1A isoform X1 [Octopus bimaculoides]|uniref:Vesicle transport through interaction with t-SNAREs homolog 1A n=1 Tax=Octopus bimaculoides TaxID=37653 RepID=A0A0L8FU75_OCTBM|nr:vesicle transport through interaction with t-SNAREs homolog 1A isoform X1 [Octopus bimaculoides]|eukprot:XP_014786813.1 PREDICTED: vesicle transport through interaction with t-SNAREs homolog 1A-like isoform X1 [Octopus bimaculoides]